MTVFEQNVAMGAFTHRTTYLPALMDSVKKHIPQIQFITHIADAPINQNMESLRKKFIATNKRYWIFLDDDIEFLNKNIVHDAVRDLIANKWAAVGVYSTFDKQWGRENYKPENITAREVGWVPGYFVLVDSFFVGDIQPDLELPDGNTAVDTSYCVSIRSRGHKIGISPNVVYHNKKAVKSDPQIAKATNEYLFNKWKDYYFMRTGYQGVVLEWGIG